MQIEEKNFNEYIELKAKARAKVIENNNKFIQNFFSGKNFLFFILLTIIFSLLSGAIFYNIGENDGKQASMISTYNWAYSYGYSEALKDMEKSPIDTILYKASEGVIPVLFVLSMGMALGLAFHGFAIIRR